MTRNNSRLGILFMVATTLVFAIQDGVSRHLAEQYNVYVVVMIRYWFFAAFILTWASYQTGGLRTVAKTRQIGLQIFRGLLLLAEINVMVLGFVYLGLVEAYAAFACYPLLIAALSGPVLGEYVGWRRWLAIGVGFLGMLIILQPGKGVFSVYTVLPLASAVMFALYGLLTRFAARKDSAATSFFWTGIAGAIGATAIGIFYWEPMTGIDYGWMLCLCLTGVLGHYLLIKCYEVAEAGAVQPFSYLHIVFGSLLGIWIFGEILKSTTVIGATIIILAGLFTLWREQANRKQQVS